jgi:hypothetical protein
MKKCKDHPFYDHGFDRNSSHAQHDYVCTCEGEMEPIIHWFNFQNWESITKFSEYMDVDVTTLSGVEYEFLKSSFVLNGKQYTIENECVGVSDDRKKIIIGSIDYL